MRNLIIILSSIILGCAVLSAQTTNPKVVESTVDMMGVSGRDSLTLKLRMSMLIRDEIQAMPATISNDGMIVRLEESKSLERTKNLLQTGDFNNKNVIMVSARYELADGRVIYIDIKRYIDRNETEVSVMVIQRTQ